MPSPRALTYRRSHMAKAPQNRLIPKPATWTPKLCMTMALSHAQKPKNPLSCILLGSRYRNFPTKSAQIRGGPSEPFGRRFRTGLAWSEGIIILPTPLQARKNSSLSEAEEVYLDARGALQLALEGFLWLVMGAYRGC